MPDFSGSCQWAAIPDRLQSVLNRLPGIGRRLRSEGLNRPPSGIGHLQTLEDDRFVSAQRTDVSPPPTRSGPRAQLPHAAAQLASQQGAQSHPVGVADPRSNLIDAFSAGAQQMHGTLDAQILKVRQG